jgi:hypothetical protein
VQDLMWNGGKICEKIRVEGCSECVEGGKLNHKKEE